MAGRNGKEIVMDAGCGSGLLTKLLAEKVPRGKVYAVDNDINMIRQAKRNLAELRNVEIVLADLAKVKLSLEVDVIFFLMLCFTGFMIIHRFFNIFGKC